MSAAKFDFVIAGAGVAALASARYIARAAPTARIALVSPHAPMSLTSSLSTECFRDHWPSSSMRAFMARSIALIEEQAAGGAFRVTPFGYLYCSSRPGAAAAFAAEAAACHGAAGARESQRRTQPSSCAVSSSTSPSGAAPRSGEPSAANCGEPRPWPGALAQAQIDEPLAKASTQPGASQGGVGG
jgi:glycine/D-amino acid oxidase-like deaminating enzyme